MMTPNDPITANAIATVLSSLMTADHEALKVATQEDLEDYWFFHYDTSQSNAWNLYQFHSLLDIYRRRCRTWEDLHHGSCCVVERVRDRYLMPKIEQFLIDLQAHQEAP